MRIVLIVLVFALTLYALLDCARTPDESMPARMPKYLWITLVVLFPTIGPIAWIIFSRVKAAEERGGYVEPTVWSSKEGTTFRRPQRPRPMAPDDDPEFLFRLERDIQRKRREDERRAQKKTLTAAEREATIRRLEKEMKEASKMLEFEYAAVLRDQIIELRGGK